MILDKIENYALYATITDRLAKGFEFIKNIDPNTIELGTYEIEDKAVFAVVQEYDTKEIKDCLLESHIKYIDIQYVLEGTELMGVATKKDQKVLEVDTEKDFIFYEAETPYIQLVPGMFTVFFPDDLHRPCVKDGAISRVKKVVVKVQV
ncbi:YhcH/YjgK/YiaL family protein [Flavobacterium crassostreae]|uniref:YhcH/YjgK/YiaL family protein n=1 Tax=Flavobacterium crassostreae TaxID=1763534 RepID=A0A1B9E9X1_9FLAO|nr:YhcH/YjgK/YiaL family protein [Flavobacterium crassostreae]OCB78745.1 hypothetical protein LPBF_01765 [Flavobacterium crassostreae]